MSHERAETASTGRKQPDAEGDKLPAPGPHAKPDLIDPERTPGAGTLSDADKTDVGDDTSS